MAGAQGQRSVFVFLCFRVRCAREGGSVISGFELDFEVSVELGFRA